MNLDDLPMVYRFEVYVPTYFTVPNPDSDAPVVREVDQSLLDAFVEDTLSRYQGVTQSNPATVTPFRGMWRQGEWSPLHVDHLTVVFCLVRPIDLQHAIDHFNGWKERLKHELNQDEVLVLIQPLHTISDF